MKCRYISTSSNKKVKEKKYILEYIYIHAMNYWKKIKPSFKSQNYTAKFF